MSDEELRALAKEAASGEEGAVLRYAKALERAGRGAEAVSELFSHMEHATARAELARLAPTPRARTLDHLSERALVSRPRLEWSSSAGRADATVVPSPLGVAAQQSRLHSTMVLNARGGARRVEVRGAPWTIVDGVLLLVEPEAIAAVDVWTGEPLWRIEGVRAVARSERTFVLGRISGVGCELEVHVLDRPRETPTPRSIVLIDKRLAQLRVFVGGDHVLVNLGSREVRAYDTRTRQLAFQLDGRLLAADDRAYLLGGAGGVCTLHTFSGEKVSLGKLGGYDHDFTPSLLVVPGADEALVEAVRIYDRASGSQLATVPVACHDLLASDELLIVHDAPEQELVAFRPRSGEELWRAGFGDIERGTLAASHGRLFATARDGRVLCLAAP